MMSGYRMFFFIMSLCLSSTIFTQSLSWTLDSDDKKVYNYILTDYIKTHQSSFENGEMLLERNVFNFNDISSSINKIKIYKVCINKKLFNKKGKKLIVYRITPLRLTENGFLINVIKFETHINKKNITMNNAGGKSYYFDYDCASNSLISRF